MSRNLRTTLHECFSAFTVASKSTMHYSHWIQVNLKRIALVRKSYRPFQSTKKPSVKLNVKGKRQKKRPYMYIHIYNMQYNICSIRIWHME